MELHEVDSKLSSQSYWDDVLKSARLPRVNSPKSYLYRVTMKFVDPILTSKKYKTFFEVGCGSSGWLPYFAKKYGYTVSGLDYSEIGCQLAEKNLELLGINHDRILCRDFFAPDPTDGKKFDVVFSYGVIEHFTNPEEIVGIFNRFLNDDGVMITLVPNFTGLNARITKTLMPEVYNIHRKITKEQLASYHVSNNLTVLKNEYAGIFSFGVMPLIKSDHWLLRKNTFRRKVFIGIFNLADKVLSNLFKLIHFDIPSRVFSPYVICIAKK
jgi:2-polyprenyl-3-methyl-5-hydroxy-6-metoxy-1,4-benzoquinol methylase